MKHAMSDRAPAGSAPIRAWLRAPQCVLLILGSVTVLGPILIGLFAVGGAGPNYAGMIGMGLALGVPMLLLGLVAHPAALGRSAALRWMVGCATACAVAAVGGIVVHNLGAAVAGEDSIIAVISFFGAILGIPLFLLSALAAIPWCAAQQWLESQHR